MTGFEPVPPEFQSSVLPVTPHPHSGRVATWWAWNRLLLSVAALYSFRPTGEDTTRKAKRWAGARMALTLLERRKRKAPVAQWKEPFPSAKPPYRHSPLHVVNTFAKE